MPVRSTRISTSPGLHDGSGTSRSHSPGAASALTSARIVRASALPRRARPRRVPHAHLGTAAAASQATHRRRSGYSGSGGPGHGSGSATGS